MENIPPNRSRARPCNPPKRRGQHGFSLIEVLIAAVLFAIGLGAVIGLQLFTLSGTHIASNRGKALMLIADIAERIRGNPAAGISGNYDYNGSAGEPSTNCDTQACTAQELAAFDLWRWQQQLTTVVALQDAGGTVEHHNDGSYTIKVNWVDQNRDVSENMSLTQRIYFYSNEQVALLAQ